MERFAAGLCRMPIRKGWSGWDDYAPFYDWENARTFGRRDLPFWRRIVSEEAPPVLELGCGTGRLLVPLSRAGGPASGIDRSAEMLSRARDRARRLPRRHRPRIVRGDVCRLPFSGGSHGVVLAP